jgi:hypothetical protein
VWWSLSSIICDSSHLHENENLFKILGLIGQKVPQTGINSVKLNDYDLVYLI